jgi:hypothetical protein
MAVKAVKAYEVPKYIQEFRQQVYQAVLDEPDTILPEIAARFEIKLRQLLYILELYDYHRPRGGYKRLEVK